MDPKPAGGRLNKNARRRAMATGRKGFNMGQHSTNPREANNPMLAAALALASKGRKVFPVHSPVGTGCSCGNPRCGKNTGKHPRTAHGFLDATTDERQIREWWTSWPSANIGTPTGRDAGIMVLDIDPRNGGVDSFYQLQDEHGRIPDTAHTRTGGGGDHFIFRYPAGAGTRSLAGLRPGLDIKADGGYILLPPSLHASGQRYAWQSNIALADPPDWLLKLILERSPKADAGQTNGKRRIREGGRNDYLTRLAGSLRHTGASPESLQTMLLQVNKIDCDPPLSDDEVRRIAVSVGRYPAGEAAKGPATLKTMPLTDVTATTIHWLWHPYIPLGKVTAVEGDPGLGKSWLLLALAAAVSRGWPLPGGDPQPPAKVLLMSAEDGLADTIRPRFDSLEGDPGMITVVPLVQDDTTGHTLTLDEEGCLALETTIAEIGPTLVVIDPLFAFTGATVDIHKANETRAILARLAAVADRYHCAIVFLRHLTKGGRDKSIYRGIGSIDITAACRSVLLVGRDPTDKEHSVICHTKSNLARCGESLGFTLERGVFEWTGKSDLTAANILAPELDKKEESKQEAAADFLTDLLADGPVLVSKIMERWKGSQPTLYRAKKELKVESVKHGFGGSSYWALPHANDPHFYHGDKDDEKDGKPPRSSSAHRLEKDGGKTGGKYMRESSLSHLYQPLIKMDLDKDGKPPSFSSDFSPSRAREDDDAEVF